MTPSKPINGARLRIARRIAGLSLEDLSRRLGGLVTRQALSKYEQGRMTPSPEVLKRLAEVLDLRPRYSETQVLAVCEEAPAISQDSYRPRALRMRDHQEPYDAIISAKVSESILNTDEPLAFIKTPDLIEENSVQINAFRFNSSIPAASGAKARHKTLRKPLSPDDLSSIKFRKSAPLPKKREEALKQIALEYLTRYGDLEDLLGMAIPFENPIPCAPAQTVEGIEEAAAAVRERWGLGLAPIGNFLEILETRGIKVFEIRDLEGMEDFDGLAAGSDRGFVVALNMARPADRIRFTAAHELAHIICGFDGAGETERLCHVFAGALLLPREALERELFHPRRKLTLWELGAIKEKYGISLQAVMHRASDLGLIAPRHLRDFAETVRKNGWTITEPVAYEGREEAVRFKRLLHYAVAEKIIGTYQAALFAGVPVSKIEKEMGTMV